jgi:asparagine synthase (glutamine-hydrolysing)
MTAALAHRGPDDEGIEVLSNEPNVVFGHRRLAIIDTSRAGHQPMADTESGCWIAYNGELYNFRELRRELVSLGHTFRSQCDTEVLLKAYVQWGTDCAEKLRGIFAFAVWDPRQNQLLLARDQLGVKPLYYARVGKGIVFASEVRALLASGVVRPRVSWLGARSYLESGSVQDPLTLVKEVISVRPGRTILWHDGRVEERVYWRLPEQATEQSNVGKIVEHVAEALTDATSHQLVSDVPLGAFLSGGIDSTSVVALMQKVSSTPIRTFSVIFEEVGYDERRFSRLAAQSLGTAHTELLLHSDNLRRGLDKAVDAFDQPSVDGLNTYFISEATKAAGITVALSGVGGDEVFAGYVGHRRALLAEKWGNRVARVPAPMRHFGATVLQKVPVGGRTRRVAEFLESERPPFFFTRQLFSQRQAENLLPGPDRTDGTSSGQSELMLSVREMDPVNRAAALEVQTYLLSTLLRDTDQMGMAHALEIRVPLLDHKLVELMFSLPGRFKVGPGKPKPLLTQALRGQIPQECINRQKRGFELPFARWLIGKTGEEIRDNFASCSTLPFRRSGLDKLWQDFENGRTSWSRVWAIFVLRRWAEAHRLEA